MATLLVAQRETDLLNANKDAVLEASPEETPLPIRLCIFIRPQDKHGQETEFYKTWEYLKSSDGSQILKYSFFLELVILFVTK
jgi:hypothetical protein